MTFELCAPCCHMRMLGNEDTQTRIENPTVRRCTMRSLLDSTRRIAWMAVGPPPRPLSSCKRCMYELTARVRHPWSACLRRDKWPHPRCCSSMLALGPNGKPIYRRMRNLSRWPRSGVPWHSIARTAPSPELHSCNFKGLGRAIRTTVPVCHRLNFSV